MGDDRLQSQRGGEFGALVRRGQQFQVAACQHHCGMRVKGKQNGRRAVGVRACRELTQNGLVAAMDAVEDANRQPGVLKRNVGEGTIMLHG